MTCCMCWYSWLAPPHLGVDSWGNCTLLAYTSIICTMLGCVAHIMWSRTWIIRQNKELKHAWWHWPCLARQRQTVFHDWYTQTEQITIGKTDLFRPSSPSELTSARCTDGMLCCCDGGSSFQLHLTQLDNCRSPCWGCYSENIVYQASNYFTLEEATLKLPLGNIFYLTKVALKK